MGLNEHGKKMLTEIYYRQVGDYPKFFKMDMLCRLGFIASELLIKDIGETAVKPREDRAVVMFNRSSSLCADRQFQATIENADDYYPSPSIFVYTLPNIITGELAIRNQYYGETAFYILNKFDASIISMIAGNALASERVESVLTGWVECSDDDHFECVLWLVDGNDNADLNNIGNQINIIYNNIH